MSTENEETVAKIKAWLLPAAGGLLGVLLNMQVSSAVGELKEVRQQMQQTITKSEVANAQVEYLQQRVVNLETARKEAGDIHNQLETRLNSLEQRAAIHDQYMQTHK
jgi:predicted RNase H-like nuclease (RuvC/YqgF family)